MQSRSYRSLAIQQLYKKRSLEDIQRRAATCPDDAAFAQFHKETVEGLFVGFRTDFLAVSTIRVDDRLLPVGGVDCVPLGLDASIVDHYETVAETDIMAPVVYANPGRVVHHAAVLADDAWLDHPFFRDHCQIYDIRHALMVAFLYPGHEQKLLTVEYLASPDNLTWISCKHGLLELATFPFALAWFFRKRAMDDAWLARVFRALQDLTSAELALLRKYVNSPYKSLGEQAADLGRGNPQGYKNQLRKLRDKLAYRFDWGPAYEEDEREKPRRPLRPLDADYAFMRMLGDPTAKLILP